MSYSQNREPTPNNIPDQIIYKRLLTQDDIDSLYEKYNIDKGTIEQSTMGRAFAAGLAKQNLSNLHEVIPQIAEVIANTFYPSEGEEYDAMIAEITTFLNNRLTS